MTKILTRNGIEFDPAKARSAVAAMVAIMYGTGLDGTPISAPESLYPDNVKPSGHPYKIIERFQNAAPFVKIEDGVVTFNPAITV